MTLSRPAGGSSLAIATGLASVTVAVSPTWWSHPAFGTGSAVR
jgi:hypothetical protein